MLLGGLVGQQFVKDLVWIILFVSLFGLGFVIGILFVVFIMWCYGCCNGYVVGVGFGVVLGLIVVLGIMLVLFWIFCVGIFLVGFYGVYVQSYCFVVVDIVEDVFKVKVIFWVMVGGFVGVIIGLQLVIFMCDVVVGMFYVGSFFSQVLLLLIVLLILLMLCMLCQILVEVVVDSGCMVLQFLVMLCYVLVVVVGVVFYGVMVFVMIVVLVVMVNYGYLVDNVVLGIQWYLLVMFGLSFFIGWLMVCYGKECVIVVGMVLFVVFGVVVLGGFGLFYFWGLLVLLGIGWNFSFIGVMVVVIDCYILVECSKVQGMNDFFVFVVMVVVLFFVGLILYSLGWQVVNWMIFLVLVLILVLLLWQIV